MRGERVKAALYDAFVVEVRNLAFGKPDLGQYFIGMLADPRR